MTNSASLRALAATPYLDRARDAAFRGRFGEAEQHLGNARRLNPAGYEASLLTAKIRLREGRLEECREALLEARRLGHPVSESEQMLAWLDAHGKSRMGDPRATPSGEAAARVQELQDVPELERLGTTRDLVASLGQLRAHLERQPACPAGLARSAELLARQSLVFGGSRAMLDEAETCANRAIAILPQSSEAHASLGFVFGMRGLVDDAERRWHRAIALDASNWFALHCLGLSLTQRGLYEQGARLLAGSMALRPLFIPNYDAIHRAYRGLSIHDGAAQVLDQGIERAGERLAVVEADLVARVHLAILWARKGGRSESREVASDVAERHPKSGFGMAHLAIAHGVLGDHQEVLTALASARDRNYDIRSVTGRPEFDVMRSSEDFLRLERTFPTAQGMRSGASGSNHGG